jgi:hypothetical protein
MPQVGLPDFLHLCRISECLYTPFVQDQPFPRPCRHWLKVLRPLRDSVVANSRS